MLPGMGARVTSCPGCPRWGPLGYRIPRPVPDKHGGAGHPGLVGKLWGLAFSSFSGFLSLPHPQGRTLFCRGFGPGCLLPADCAQDALILLGFQNAPGSLLFSTQANEHTQQSSLQSLCGLGAHTWGWGGCFPSCPHGWLAAPWLQHRSGTHFQEKAPSTTVRQRGCVLLGLHLDVSMWECLEHIREGASGYAKQACCNAGVWSPGLAASHNPGPASWVHEGPRRRRMMGLHVSVHYFLRQEVSPSEWPQGAFLWAAPTLP